MKTQRLLLLAMGVGLVVPVAMAQDTDELGLAYAKAQEENVGQIKTYKWKTHTTMKSQGETKFSFTVANRLNEKGEMVQELEESESNVKRKRGLRGRRQRAALEEADALLDNILAITATYIFMSKGREVDFFDKATITDGEGDLKGTQKVHANGVTIEGDSLTKWIDPTTLHPKRIAFQFVVDGHAVEGEVMYRPIEDGPNVPRLSTIRIADMNAVVEMEFLDYAKQL
jgi:hypothetical protein